MSQQINLYNPLFCKQKKYFSAVTMLEALGLILVGSLLFYGYAGYRAAALEKRAGEIVRANQATQAQLAQLTAEFGARKPSQLLAAEITRTGQQMNARRRMIEQLNSGVLGNTRGFSEYLRALARQRLDGLWITGFHVSGTGADMTINGRALQPELVPVFIHQLRKETMLAGQTFTMLEIRAPQAQVAVAGKVAPGPPYVEFSLRKAQTEPPK